MSKLIYFLILLSIGAGNLRAQQNSAIADAPKIAISKVGWSKIKYFPRTLPRDETMQAATVDQNSPIIEPNRLPVNPPKNYFMYQADFANETGQKLKGIVWEYIFSNLKGEELQRHEFYYPYEIGKNKKFTARNRLNSPPTGSINIDDLQNGGQSSYVERVEIKCVIYDNGNIWQKSKDSFNSCQKLADIIKKGIGG